MVTRLSVDGLLEQARASIERHSAAETYRLAIVAANGVEPPPMGLLSLGLRQPGVGQPRAGDSA